MKGLGLGNGEEKKSSDVEKEILDEKLERVWIFDGEIWEWKNGELNERGFRRRVCLVWN
jgi:hypothetical protein